MYEYIILLKEKSLSDVQICNYKNWYNYTT